MVIQFSDLAGVRAKHGAQKLVLTSGTYDLLHVGHVRYLDEVKKLGDILIVMLSSDARVRARKGSARPIIPEQDRAAMLDALKVVDYVFIDPASNPDEFDPVHASIIAELQPDIYATDGPDPRFWDLLEPSQRAIVSRSETEGHASTSAIIEVILNQAK